MMHETQLLAFTKCNVTIVQGLPPFPHPIQLTIFISPSKLQQPHLSKGGFLASLLRPSKGRAKSADQKSAGPGLQHRSYVLE